MNSWLIQNYIKHFFKATRKGHGVHSPFVYRLCENVFYNKFEFYAFQQLKELRGLLEKENTGFEITDHGAGSKKLNGNKRALSSIIKHGISSIKQSEIYFKLINYLQPKTVIELGTSIGLNTLYLSEANKQAEIYTIEAEKQLTAFAARLFKTHDANNINLTEGLFETKLTEVLQKAKQVDCVYIDGHHTYIATLENFKTILPYTHENSFIIIDDIYWSKDMTNAWKKITEEPSVTLSIDCFYFGIVFFRKESKQKEHFRLLI